MAPRLPPLDPADFTPRQAELVGDWSHLVFSRVIVRHPELYAIFIPYIRQVIAESILPARDREVLVLRVLARADETYELHHHRVIAAKAGMSDSEIAAACSGSGLDEWDAALVRAADELVDAKTMSDASWAALSARYDDKQMMEVVFLVGCYAVMAMLTKTFGMELESAAEDARIQSLRAYT